MNVEVRRFLEDDLDAVCVGLPSRPASTHRRRLERQRRDGYVQLIAWIDGAPVGAVGLGGGPGGRDVEDLCEYRGFPVVHDLYVEHAFRRRGAGRALMEEVDVLARALDADGITLETGIAGSYAPARALYRSLGYRDLGGVFLSSWSDPARDLHVVDPLTLWVKRF
jgi:GNAT superfamily N-acetyltransferase